MNRRGSILGGWLFFSLACNASEESVDRSEGAEGLRGLEMEESFEVPDFSLLDTRGVSFDFRVETSGSLALLFFGYTHCPDICPVQLSILDAALEDLSYDERKQIEVVFVTTDPGRDTPERLRDWLDQFDTAFVGLVGDLERINEIQAELKLPAAVIDPPHDSQSPEDYYVGHATPIVAVTGDGQVRAFYPSGIRQTDWQHDLPLLLALNTTAGASGGP